VSQVRSSEVLRDQFLALPAVLTAHCSAQSPIFVALIPCCDVSQVWSSEVLREQFLALPLPAVPVS
jgi:hypothetical protein